METEKTVHDLIHESFNPDKNPDISSASTEPDRMPAETALSILTDRLAKHSSAFKRTAREARENYIGLPKTAPNPFLKLRVRLSRLTITQLNHVINRSKKAAARLSVALQKVPEGMAQWKAPLASKIAWVEMVMKLGYLEAVRRKAICENYPMARTGLTTYEDELKKYPQHENATPAV